MPYMRRSYMNRRFIRQEPALPQEPAMPRQGTSESKAGEEAVEKLINIPLPNEKEEAVAAEFQPRELRRSSFLSFLKSRIHIEEIILLGLIFLLLEEGIDDEFLLILLIYILLG